MTVVDASVMVAVYYPQDRHHHVSAAWFNNHVLSGRDLVAPLLILTEIASGIARQSNNAALAYDAVQRFRAVPNLYLIPLDDTMAMRTVTIAADLQIRGADAVYVAVADYLHMRLVTWDAEQQTRGGQRIVVSEPVP